MASYRGLAWMWPSWLWISKKQFSAISDFQASFSLQVPPFTRSSPMEYLSPRSFWQKLCKCRRLSHSNSGGGGLGRRPSVRSRSSWTSGMEVAHTPMASPAPKRASRHLRGAERPSPAAKKPTQWPVWPLQCSNSWNPIKGCQTS